MRRARAASVALFLGGAIMALSLCAGETRPAEARAPSCPAGMSLVDPGLIQPPADGGTTPMPASSYCIDRYEGSLVEVGDEGEHSFSPFDMVKGRKVRAVSRSGVVPQAYLSRNEAAAACKASHKRLCAEKEWVAACRGKRPTTYPYGDDR